MTLTAHAQHAQRAQHVHSAHFMGRDWGISGQLAIFLPIQTILHPHNPRFHPAPTPQATQGPELQLVALRFLVYLAVVNDQTQCCGPWFGDKKTGAAMPGVFLIFIFFNEPNIYTFLDLVLDFFNLILRSGIP